TVLVQDACVQSISAIRATLPGRLAGRSDIAAEFVEKQTAQRFRGSGIAREHRSLDRFGEIDERKDGPVGVGEIWPKRFDFVSREGVLCFSRERHGGQVFYLSCPTRVFPSGIGSPYGSAIAIRWGTRIMRRTSRTSSNAG